MLGRMMFSSRFSSIFFKGFANGRELDLVFKTVILLNKPCSQKLITNSYCTAKHYSKSWNLIFEFQQKFQSFLRYQIYLAFKYTVHWIQVVQMVKKKCLHRCNALSFFVGLQPYL